MLPGWADDCRAIGGDGDSKQQHDVGAWFTVDALTVTDRQMKQIAIKGEVIHSCMDGCIVRRNEMLCETPTAMVVPYQPYGGTIPHSRNAKRPRVMWVLPNTPNNIHSKGL